MLSDPDRARHFEALVHASPDFLALADIEGRVQFVSVAGRRLVGMPDDVDVTTTTIADYLTEEGMAASLEVEQQIGERSTISAGYQYTRGRDLIISVNQNVPSCVAAGTNNPLHSPVFTPAKPTSFMLGTSGNSAERSEPVTASARTLPPFTSGMQTLVRTWVIS